MIKITCTSCKAMLSIDDAFAGGVCRCQHCGTIQTVPAYMSQVAGISGAAAPQAGKTLYERQGRGEGSADQNAAYVRTPASQASPARPARQAVPPAPGQDHARQTRLLLIVAGAVIIVLVVLIILLVTAAAQRDAYGRGARPRQHRPTSPGVSSAIERASLAGGIRGTRASARAPSAPLSADRPGFSATVCPLRSMKS